MPYINRDGVELRRVSIYIQAGIPELHQEAGIPLSPVVNKLLLAYWGRLDADAEGEKLAETIRAAEEMGHQDRTREKAKKAKVKEAVETVKQSIRAEREAEISVEIDHEAALGDAWKALAKTGKVPESGRLQRYLDAADGRYDDDWIDLLYDLNEIAGKSFSIGEVKAYARARLAVQ
jgi:hypothetical protein